MADNKVFIESVSNDFMNVILNKTVHDTRLMDSSELKQNALYYIHAWGTTYKTINDKPSVFSIALNKIKRLHIEIPRKFIDPMSLIRRMRKNSKGKEKLLNKKSLVLEAKDLIMQIYTQTKDWIKNSEEIENLESRLGSIHKQLLEQMLIGNKEKDLELVLNIIKEIPILIPKVRKNDIQAKVKLAEMCKTVEVSNTIAKKTMPKKFFTGDTSLNKTITKGNINNSVEKEILSMSVSKIKEIDTNKAKQIVELKEKTIDNSKQEKNNNIKKLGLTRTVKEKRTNTDLHNRLTEESDQQHSHTLINPKAKVKEQPLTQKEDVEFTFGQNASPSFDIIQSKQQTKVNGQEHDSNGLYSNTEVMHKEELEKALKELKEESINLRRENIQMSNINAQLLYEYNIFSNQSNKEMLVNQSLLDKARKTLNDRGNKVKELYWNKKEHEQLNEIVNKLQEAIRIHMEQTTLLTNDIMKEQTELNALLKKREVNNSVHSVNESKEKSTRISSSEEDECFKKEQIEIEIEADVKGSSALR